ncbi:MAG: hypothetical protein EAZ32_06510 [Cytophagia bacterium]|nr:MAG: hypothetical protein EAZ38_19180 [Cytophagales bacterium]TAG40382.1 MAG: hypothetical protein EAZ32_06510 [Cytophagia bacterium]TAG56871.1 MAG: hypothetical protein EAZ29_02635 [Runella slithyformis]TAG67099.1 MAG: hypothetical protein EAZ26_09100 [Runella slithyformis]TAG77246.1 MAG: hypothetical protein EAZ22_16080 [Cytophagales bacterium]
MKLFQILLFFVFVASTAMAQPLRNSRVVGGFDIGAGFEQKNLMPSLQVYQLLKIGKSGIFQAGYSFRLNRFMGSDINLLSSQNDTLQMDKTAVTMLNFGLKAQISLKWVEIGASADLFGLAFGGKQTGLYVSSRAFNKTDTLNLHRTKQQAGVRRGNLQLFNNNNSIGNLNADVYARVWVSRQVGLKVGYIFNLTQYRTDRALLNDNRDFRFTPRLFYVGVSFPILN